MRRQPYTRATDVLYKLTTIYYQGKSAARYPRFEVRREVTGYFHSLEDAERRIRKYVTDEEKAESSGKYRSDYDYYYGFVIDEIPFDWHLTGDAQHARIYLEDGTFLHETKVSALYNKDCGGALEPFDGRPKEECRFEVGDLVEVLSGDMVSLEIVYSQPPSPARAAEIRRRVCEEFQKNCVGITDDELNEEMDYALDITDDSYTTLDGDEGYMSNHSHSYITQLFPARRKVPYLLRKKLERGLEIALQENETYLY